MLLPIAIASLINWCLPHLTECWLAGHSCSDGHISSFFNFLSWTPTTIYIFAFPYYFIVHISIFADIHEWRWETSAQRFCVTLGETMSVSKFNRHEIEVSEILGHHINRLLYTGLILGHARKKSAGHIKIARVRPSPSVRPEGQKIILSKNTF